MSNSTVGEADTNLYAPYVPSKVAAYAYVALFAIGGLVHFILIFPFQAAFFLPLIIGCASKCWKHPFTKHTLIPRRSGGWWLLLSCLVERRYTQDFTFCYSRPSYSRRSAVSRCHNLHDTGPHHSQPQSRSLFSDCTSMVDKAFCLRRHRMFCQPNSWINHASK